MGIMIHDITDPFNKSYIFFTSEEHGNEGSFYAYSKPYKLTHSYSSARENINKASEKEGIRDQKVKNAASIISGENRKYLFYLQIYNKFLLKDCVASGIVDQDVPIIMLKRILLP